MAVFDRNREQEANTPAYDFLSVCTRKGAYGADLVRSHARKAVVVDAGYPDQTALIMTLNLTKANTQRRDFAVVDRNPVDVAAIASVFNADYEATRPHQRCSNT